MIGMGTLAGLARLRPGVKRMRESSYDRNGGNFDWWEFEPGVRRDIASIEGAGCIKHIWMTMGCDDKHVYRKVVLRMWWDGEDAPSVETPIGDFFGMGHGLTRNFVSLPLQMSPEDGRSFNCWFPMPFEQGARIEVENATGKTQPVLLHRLRELSQRDKHGRIRAIPCPVAARQPDAGMG